jgi:hypothetical protein
MTHDDGYLVWMSNNMNNISPDWYAMKVAQKACFAAP